MTKTFNGEPQLLKRCISNAVDNATTYGQRAAIRIEEGPDQLTIRVRDHGPGIPDGELETVFQPFYRLESLNNRQPAELGLD